MSHPTYSFYRSLFSMKGSMKKTSCCCMAEGAHRWCLWNQLLTSPLLPPSHACFHAPSLHAPSHLLLGLDALPPLQPELDDHCSSLWGLWCMLHLDSSWNLVLMELHPAAMSTLAPASLMGSSWFPSWMPTPHLWSSSTHLMGCTCMPLNHFWWLPPPPNCSSHSVPPCSLGWILLLWWFAHGQCWIPAQYLSPSCNPSSYHPTHAWTCA